MEVISWRVMSEGDCSAGSEWVRVAIQCHLWSYLTDDHRAVGPDVVLATLFAGAVNTGKERHAPFLHDSQMQTMVH